MKSTYKKCKGNYDPFLYHYIYKKKASEVITGAATISFSFSVTVSIKAERRQVSILEVGRCQEKRDSCLFDRDFTQQEIEIK